MKPLNWITRPDPHGDFKFVNELVSCPACTWKSSVLRLDSRFKIMHCVLCGHSIHL